MQAILPWVLRRASSFGTPEFLSRFEVLIDGVRTEPLAAVTEDPFSATFVSRCMPPLGRADSTLMVFRSRYVGQGMREDLTIRNFAMDPAQCIVEILLGCDFADLFAVKEGRVGVDSNSGELSATVTSGDLATTRPHDGDDEGVRGPRPGGQKPNWQPSVVTYSYRRSGGVRGVEMRFNVPATVSPDRATFEVVVPPRGEWSTCIEVAPVFDGARIRPEVSVR